MSAPITGYAKATELLYRWLRHDAGHHDDPTLDDETNDYLQAFTLPRVERDQAVLQACAALDLRQHPTGSVTCYAGTRGVELSEWERRRFAEVVAEFRQKLGAGQPNPEGQRLLIEGWRRLETLR
jgi:hypothetical protein